MDIRKLSFVCIGLFIGITTQGSNTDKTLVAWVEINDVSVRGGSILTIQSGDKFDGIVFGETEEGKWIAGSDQWNRTHKDLSNVKPETEDSQGKLIQMAVVYKGKNIRIYRNGILYSAYEAENIDLLNDDQNFVLFGLRQVGAEAFISAEIEDARIYSTALTPEQISSLKPDEPSDIEPYAWWDFEGEEPSEKTGSYLLNMIGHADDAELKDGRLVLREWGSLIAFKEYVEETPQWPDNPPEDWLTFHLAHPGPGLAKPGDPNPAYFYNGRYHLHYIYMNQYGFAFAHVSSTDMVHWKWHPTVLSPPTTGHGMFSGTGFYTEDGTPAMIYHGEGSGRNMIAYALDDHLDKWTKPEPIIPLNENGEEPDIRHWDPDLWQIGETYFALSGGKDPELMKSENLKDWLYVGKLLHEDFPDDLGMSREEDISCANMFKIGDKWMLLCISHHFGCRYYLGDFKDGKYLPESHTLMNWVTTNWEGKKGLVYFAPESMLAEDGRRVMWTWLITDVNPTGVQSLPRELELPDDGVLRMKPLKELESLRYDGTTLENVTVREGKGLLLDKVKGDAVELEVKFKAPLPKEFGINMLGDESGNDELSIIFGAGQKELSIGNIKPPFELKAGEELTLRIFIDKNLVEVFANDRQAAVVSHASIRKNPNIKIFTKDKDLFVKEIHAWEMKSIY